MFLFIYFRTCLLIYNRHPRLNKWYVISMTANYHQNELIIKLQNNNAYKLAIDWVFFPQKNKSHLF